MKKLLITIVSIVTTSLLFSGCLKKNNQNWREHHSRTKIGGNFSKDDNYIYHLENRTEKLEETKDLKFLMSGWGKNENVYSYLYVRRIREADVETFKVLDDLYAKDKDHVFFNATIIPDADPKTFKVFEWKKEYGNKGEGTGSFWRVEVKGFDPENMKLLKKGYARDINHVYKDGNIVEGADPENFTP